MVAVLGRSAVGAGRFLYRFLVGDDWRVALVMLLALVATGILVAGHLAAWWLVPLLAVLATGFSLRLRPRA